MDISMHSFTFCKKSLYSVFMISILLISACSKKEKEAKADAKQEQQADANAVISVTVEHPKEEQVADTITTNGTLQPWQEASIGTEVSGLRIKSVLVNVGDWVQKGQLLLTYKGETVVNDTERLISNVIEAEASYANARDNASRFRQLAGTGAISGLELTQAVNNEKASKARLEALKASLDQQKTKQSYLELRSPDNGIISSRNATAGNVVSAGSEQFKLIRDGKLEWVAEVSPDVIDNIHLKMPVQVHGLKKEVINGTVRAIAPLVDSKNKSVPVYVSLPPNILKQGLGVAGMSTTGKFDIGETSGLTLPLSAFTLRDGTQYVYKLKPDNHVAQTAVKLGNQTGNRYIVQSGVSASDEIVTSGVGFLNDGDKVKVVSQSQGSGQE